MAFLITSSGVKGKGKALLDSTSDPPTAARSASKPVLPIPLVHAPSWASGAEYWALAAGMKVTLGLKLILHLLLLHSAEHATTAWLM